MKKRTSKKEQFLMAVFYSALARDLAQDSCEAQLLARVASEIPEEKLPECPLNAAKVFMSYFAGLGRTRQFKWMKFGNN